ncbi:hypothetical protein RND81_12G009100 [Saponaria officinalis]|uniref:Calmodulin-binding domain-containing protein n=1 Tax=Saponaria officinalis TaxID=3572 RepID=A0AAW1H729_SAPOF
MVIRTFTAQERYSRNKGGGAEPKIKLKKLKSVKVANLDRLKSSMRREKSRFDRSFMASSVYETDLSGSSSTPMSGTSSPNYMKATTSSSARKGSPQTSSGTVSSKSAGGSNRRSKLYAATASKVHEECSDTAGVNIPVEIIRPQKGLKRMPSVKHGKKLSSMKSMKIRAKYSQFQGYCNYNNEFTMGGVVPEDKLESSDANYGHDQESIVGGGDQQKSILNRSRSIKMTRLRSKRYTRRPPKSRVGEVAEHMSYGKISNSEPHYMKGTSSHEARKNTAKGLTRTSSWRPLRILAKIPSLRQRKSKVMKRPLITPLSRASVGRATCSSTLKRSEFPDHMELHPGGQEAEGTSIVHVCPYSYCSLNGHHHHAPSPPLKEFISAKRKLLKNQKGKQLKEDVEHSTIVPKTDKLQQMVSTEIQAAQMLNSTPEEGDDGLDFLITVYAKPRKKWATEGIPSSDYEVLTGFTNNKISEIDYDWELPEAPNETSSEGRQEALSEGLQEPYGIFKMCNVEGNNESHQKISTITSNEASEPFISEEKIPSSGGDLINILSDKQKYTNIWHLIYQQFVPSDVFKFGTEGINGTDERESVDVNTCHKGNEFEQEEGQISKNHSDDLDNQETATEIPNFDQTAALKLVQDGLNAILERDAESMNQQSKSRQNMANSLVTDYTLAPEVSTEEQMKVGDIPTEMELTVSTMQQKVVPSQAEIPKQQMSKSYNKLRKIFVTAKIIEAMERMKRIRPGEPRYLPVEPTLEREKVYLRHLSMSERKNTEEWMLDYALRWAISRLGPDQQRRVAQLVEAFETVTPEQRGNIRHNRMKGKPVTTSDLATPAEPGQTTSVPDEQFNHQQDDEGLLSDKISPEEIHKREDNEDQIRARDLPLEPTGNSCKPADTQADNEGLVQEPIIIPEDPSQSPTRDSEVSHAAEMNIMFFNKQKYTCMWNLIYQQVATTETSMNEEQGANVFDEEEQGDKAIKCKEINDPELTTGSYNTNPKEEEDDQNAAGRMNESDQSAAVKLVKEALNAILTRYESNEYQAIPDYQRVASCTDESLGKDGKHLEKHEHPKGEKNMHLKEESNVSHQVEHNESKKPPREMSKSYNRLRKAFVTAKFIKAIERLRINSPRKTQSLPPETSLKEETVYLRHLSIGGRKADEECMLDYALRQVISKMGPDQQRRVAQLVEAFEKVTPQQKTENEIATAARSATHTSVSLETLTEKMHQKSISDERDYHDSQNQDNGILLSDEAKGFHERSLQKDHDHKASPADDTTLQKTVETAISDRTTEFSPTSSISTADNVATEVSSIRVEEATKDDEVSSCYPTEESEVKSGGVIATILSDKQKYTSMWQLIHQQVVSSEASKGTKQEFNEVDEEECKGINYPDSTHISSMEKDQKDKDSYSGVLNQSAAIKLVKDAIDAILQSHEQTFDQQSLQYDDTACDDAKGHCDTSALAPTEENSEGKKRTEKDTNPRSKDNFHEVDNTSVLDQTEDKAAQRKISSSHSKLKKLIVTAKFIAAMERLRKMNWSKPRYLPPNEASMDERVYLRHLSIDGRKNHDEWMLDYALRNVISSLAPEQQRKVASLVGAFERVAPERKGNGLQYSTKEKIPPAIKSEPIDDGKEFVDSKDNSTAYDDHCPKTQDDRFSMHKCAPLATDKEDECQTEISNVKKDLSSEALDSDQVDLHIHHQTIPQGCSVQEPLTVREDTDANVSKTPKIASLSEQENREHDIGKGLFSDKQKTNSMWHLICQHLQSARTAEGGSKPSERLCSNDHKKKDDKSFEIITDADYDDDSSSVTSELTEGDAIKLVKETIDDILEGPEDMDNKLISTLRTSAIEKDQIVEARLEKSLSMGYSKLRNLIICNKFIKTLQKMRKIHPQKQMIPTLSSGAVVGKARLKSSGAGEKKGTDEWMLDNVLQKVISGLAPAKQRRVALLVEAFERVHPDQEETGAGLTHIKTEAADAISLSRNVKENGDTVFESSQQSSESPDSLDLKLDGLVSISNMKLAIDRVPQDRGEGRAPNSGNYHTLNGNEMKGDTPSKLTALPSVQVHTSSDLCKDPTEVSSGVQQRFPPNEIETIEEKLVGNCDQATDVAKKASLPEGLKDEGNHSAQKSKSFDKVNNTSLWSLILQHVKTDVPEKVEVNISTEISTDVNSENSSHFSPEVFHEKEVDIPTPTSFEYYESEAIQLVQEAINELLVLPQQEDNNQCMSSSTTSEQAVSNQVHSTGRETPSCNAAQDETSVDIIVNPADESAPTTESLPSTYTKLSKVIMCKRFITAMNKMRQLKPQPPQEHSRLTHTEARETLSLRQTAKGEKKSWEEGMLDHALQQVVEKLAPAQKKRVSLLVKAFEAVGSQPEQPTTSPTVGSVTSSRKPTKFRLSRSQVV